MCCLRSECNDKEDCLMKNFYYNKKVLITGGCGFIGSHIAERLIKSGADVTILDNLSSGDINNVENIKACINFIHDSVENYDVCLRAAKGKDIIFHLAALVSVPESIEHPDVCHSVNVNGTYNLLEAARKNNVERFIFSSSAAVYGNQEDRCHENMPVNPLSPYGFSKYVGELYCREYAMLYGVKTGVLRYFNVYGQRQNPNGAYAAARAIFDKRMRMNQSLTIYGDGLQSRDFIPVGHVVDANLIIGMQSADILNGQPFNIATGKSVTLLEMIEDLRQTYPDYDQEILFEPARAGDIKHSSADSSKYQQIRKSLLNKIEI